MKKVKLSQGSKQSIATRHLTNSVRIIGGSWRSRRLRFPDLPDLRPTPDRVRETLFNWLAPYMPETRCLDLFGGSGALGFEAASRGASEVIIVEQHSEITQALQQNAIHLLAHNIQILQADSMHWLATSTVRTFDVVFLDPPYQSELLMSSIKMLEEKGWVKNGTLIYFECPATTVLKDLPITWQVCKEKQAGQIKYYLARRIKK